MSEFTQKRPGWALVAGPGFAQYSVSQIGRHDADVRVSESVVTG
jgi:hypothetical protein